MKRRLCVALALLLGLAVMLPGHVRAADAPITLELFSEKFNEASQYIGSMLGTPLPPIYPKIDLSDALGDTIKFTMDTSIAMVQGEAFGDTGVISRLEVLGKDASALSTAESMRIMSIIYAMSALESFAAATMDRSLDSVLDRVGNAKKSTVVNSYSVKATDLNGVGAWTAALEYDYKGSPPAKDKVQNPKSAFEYHTFFLDKAIAAAQAGIDRMASAPDAASRFLSSGEYTVGEHIPAGEYSATTTARAVNFFVTRAGRLHVNEVLKTDNPIGRMVLQAGDTINISGGQVELRPFK